jgi:putative ABC transport system permease protein
MVFGEEEPMGKIVELESKLKLTVTGIIENTPVNTHMPVDCLVPLEGNIRQFMNEQSLSWYSYNFSSYLLLKPNADPEEVGKKLSALIPDREDEDASKKSLFKLHPVANIYMGLSEMKYGFVKGDWKHINLFGFIGLIILLIASINYINLTTARAAHRAKATGIRKIVGATRSQLIGQHLLEAFCLVGICSLLALFLAHFSIPFFEQIAGKEFPFLTIFSLQNFLLSGGIAFATVLLSGIQPAIQLSSFRLVEVLKGSGFKGVAGKAGLRKALVIVQFVSSAALIICTLFMIRQMDFIQSAKLGYEKDHTFSFRHPGENPRVLKEALKGQAGIDEVTMSDQSIVHISNRLGGFEWEGMGEKRERSLFQTNVGYEYKDFFGLELIDGRWFKPGDSDSSSFLINETAAKALNLKEPVGKWIDFWGERGTIVGVIKDFHFQSFHNDIQQLIFRQNGDWFPTLYVKTTGENTAIAIASAEKVFKAHHPDAIFKYEFLDETYDNLYKTETKTSALFLFFALVAILISCLGIFGLATYTAEKRFKEIGIRKVLGASVYSIVHLLSKDFLKLVFASLIIAIPIAWYFMNSWLSNFAYHIKLDWWVFAVAGLLAVAIAFVTVCLQSFRAALANPVESIKE